MYKKRTIIFILITIFSSGVLTGISITPIIIYKISGNPYSYEFVSEKIFNAKFLHKLNFSIEQKDYIRDILDDYISKYKTIRNNFKEDQATLYSLFLIELEKNLTSEQFAKFKKLSDEDINKRKAYYNMMINKGIEIDSQYKKDYKDNFYYYYDDDYDD